MDICQVTVYHNILSHAGRSCYRRTRWFRHRLQMGSENRSLRSVCRSGNPGCCTCMQERRRRSNSVPLGTATGLSGIKLVVGVVINFFLGALMMIGVGLYAPCMALVGALGMNIGVAFPIMMGSCDIPDERLSSLSNSSKKENTTVPQRLCCPFSDVSV